MSCSLRLSYWDFPGLENCFVALFFSQWMNAAETHTQTLGQMHLSRLSRRQPSKQHQMMQLLRQADGTGRDIRRHGLQVTWWRLIAPNFRHPRTHKIEIDRR